MSIESNRKIIRRYFEEVWNEGDISVLDEIIDPDSKIDQVLAKEGLRAYWRKELDKISFNEDWQAQMSYRKAQLFARLGENDRAVKELEEAYRAHHHCMTGIKTDPAFDGLRRDGRFQELLARMSFG